MVCISGAVALASTKAYQQVRLTGMRHRSAVNARPFLQPSTASGSPVVLPAPPIVAALTCCPPAATFSPPIPALCPPVRPMPRVSNWPKNWSAATSRTRAIGPVALLSTSGARPPCARRARNLRWPCICSAFAPFGTKGQSVCRALKSYPSPSLTAPASTSLCASRAYSATSSPPSRLSLARPSARWLPATRPLTGTPMRANPRPPAFTGPPPALSASAWALILKPSPMKAAKPQGRPGSVPAVTPWTVRMQSRTRTACAPASPPPTALSTFRTCLKPMCCWPLTMPRTRLDLLPPRRSPGAMRPFTTSTAPTRTPRALVPCPKRLPAWSRAVRSNPVG
mmetsp:Transcript_23929/g.43551  ORF Transcript_23929/g.43551 Transcript_23929/m.43551 type:complete len:339 (-) Transcript_23929:917-1933(-)